MHLEADTLTQRLATLHEKQHCLLTASATAGLVIALRAAGLSGARVGIPNGVCLNVPLAVLYSGNIPVYLDIDTRTLGLQLSELESATPKLAAVIAVHAYGYVCDIKAIASWCHANSVFLIEDAAAAMGARLDGKPLGSHGDVSVLSFGAGKIIDAGSGGALLTNDSGLYAELRRLELGLPTGGVKEAEMRIREFSHYHTVLYNTYYDYGKDLNTHASACRIRALELQSSFMRKAQPDLFASKALFALDTLTDNLEQRNKRSTYLRGRFSGHTERGLIPFSPPSGSVIWRFSLIVERNRDAILRMLLNRGLKVSSWYPSSDLFLEERSASGVHTPNSDSIGDTILNIWVNKEVDEAYLIQISKEILAFCGVPPTSKNDLP
jgi:dTDP-4-amino-4,6-dideoxygalactose transaminase